MSLPSFSSFPPSFSSFPDLEPRPSEQTNAAEKHRKKKKARESTSQREPKPKHIYGDYSTEHDEPKRSAESSAVYFLDRKGDPYNIQYGSLNARDAPKYQPYNRGRNVMGLSPAWIATRRTNNGVEVAPKNRRVAASLTDPNTRALLAAPSRRFLRPETGNEQRGNDDYIRLPSIRHHEIDKEIYRSITVSNSKRKADSDSELSHDSSLVTDDEDSADEIHLTSYQETLKEIEQQLNENPTSSDKWLQLLSHTISTIPASSKNASKARSEITVSILSRALSADPRNGASKSLWLRYIKAGEEVWDESKIGVEWEQALKLGGIEIWMEWLEWKVRSSSAGMEGVVENAVRVLNALGHSEQEEFAKVRIFWRVALAFKSAGYAERATALFQAQAELMFQLPPALQGLPLGGRLQQLEEFWESEVSRIGEPGSHGWSFWVASGQKDERFQQSGADTVETTELDPYRQWATRESFMDRNHFLPSRSFNDTDDPYSTILFSDIKPLLLHLESPLAKNAFRCAWLSVIGLHIPGLSDSLSAPGQINWDDRWNTGFLIRRAYLDSLFSKDAIQNRLTTEAYAGVIVGREREYASGFGPVKHWGTGVLGPLDGCLEKGMSMCRMWEREDVEGLDEMFIRRLFAQLRISPTDADWDFIALAFEAAVNIKGALKLSRFHLSQNESLLRWAAHAQLEVMRGRLNDARKVYQTVLIASPASSNIRGTSFLWWNWAQMEWLSGNSTQSLHVVFCAARIEGQGGVAVLRCKHSLDDAIKGEPSWKDREGWIKLRALLELLSGNDVSAALGVFDHHLFGERKKTTSRESLTVSCLLMIYHYRVLLRNPMAVSVARQRIERALEEFPNNTIVLSLFLEAERGEGVWGRVRGILGDRGGQVKGVLRRAAEVWVAGWERGRWKYEIERTRSGLGAAVESERTRASHVVWRIYIELEIQAEQFERAKKLLFRALSECPLVKELYLLAFGPLRSVFSGSELSEIADTMAERGLRLRRGLDEGLEGWKEEIEEGPGSESDSGADEIMDNARELRRLMPY